MTGPADTLHRAAAKLRKRAEKVPPWARAEPWQVVQTDTENMDGVLIARDHQIGGDATVAIEAHRESLADYIATMHPGVGLLLAELLDHAAAWYQYGRHAGCDHDVEYELVVARAILGTDQRHSAQPGTDAEASNQGTVAG